MSTSKSYILGKSWAKKVFKENLENFGKIGIGKSDKASSTCNRYATDPKVKKTTTDKEITPEMIEFYKGASEQFLTCYNDLLE